MLEKMEDSIIEFWIYSKNQIMSINLITYFIQKDTVEVL
jgi:hypothetical protein